MLNRTSLLAALIFTLMGSTATTAVARQLNNVVVISIDALHPEALNSAQIPTINKLMQAGAYTLDGRSTEPLSMTISHRWWKR